MDLINDNTKADNIAISNNRRVLYWPNSTPFIIPEEEGGGTIFTHNQCPNVTNYSFGFVIGWEINKIVHVCCSVVLVKSDNVDDNVRERVECVLGTIRNGCSCYEDMLKRPQILARWFRDKDSALRYQRKFNTDGLPYVVSRWWWVEIGKYDGILVMYENGVGKIQSMRKYLSTGEKISSKTLKRVIGRINCCSSLNTVLADFIYEDDGRMKSTTEWTCENEKQSILDVDITSNPKYTEKKPKYHQQFVIFNTNSLFILHLMKKPAFVTMVKPLQCIYAITSILYEKKQQSCKLQPSSVKASEFLKLYSPIVSLILDTVLGIIAGTLMNTNSHALLNAIHSLWYHTLGDKLNQNILWLNDFPLGFKLNVPLTQVTNKGCMHLLDQRDSIIRLLSVSRQESAVRLIAIVGMVFGFSALLAGVVDIYRITIYPTILLARAFRYIWVHHLAFLSTLWKLLKGKKKNVLRCRIDSMEYDFMQLLLGVLLFAIGIFLLTTSLIHFIFFAGVVDFSMFCVELILVTVYVVFNEFPALPLLSRCLHKDMFPSTIILRENLSDEISLEGARLVYSLTSVAEPVMVRLSTSYSFHIKRSCASISRFFSNRSKAEGVLLFGSHIS